MNRVKQDLVANRNHAARDTLWSNLVPARLQDQVWRKVWRTVGDRVDDVVWAPVANPIMFTALGKDL